LVDFKPSPQFSAWRIELTLVARRFAFPAMPAYFLIFECGSHFIDKLARD
jgi:hypothetical protein